MITIEKEQINLELLTPAIFPHSVSSTAMSAAYGESNAFNLLVLDILLLVIWSIYFPLVPPLLAYIFVIPLIYFVAHTSILTTLFLLYYLVILLFFDGFILYTVNQSFLITVI